MNDLWDTLPPHARDDKLGLVFQSSKKNLVSINTAVGPTERVNIPEIAQQGGTWGPMMCSNSIDMVGKHAKENNQFYLYKNLVRIIPLAMVDDLLAAANCGFDSIEMNTSINKIIELKKLKFHIPEEKKKSKCHFMHIGKDSKICPGMKVHGRNADKVSQAVYLGDVISQDGSNSSNVKDRVSKGMGIITQIMNLLQTVSFGVKYFEIAVSLREAMLINGMLGSSEVWYGVKEKEIKELEDVDKLLLRKFLDAPSSSSVEGLYLELGLTPLHIILKARRINYLHYLANLNKNEMLYNFFETQWKYPCKDDWTAQVKKDMKDFGINEDLEELKAKSKNSFKKVVKIKMLEYSLDYLLNQKETHSKMDNLMYTEIKLQNYLKSKKIPVSEAKNLFRYRVRTANFKENFKGKYINMTCPFCFLQVDTQVHSVECPKVKELIKIEGKYREIFTDKISPEISKTLANISKMRKNLI